MAQTIGDLTPQNGNAPPQCSPTFPPSGLSVLITGAGFAGLTAALECTRKGHNVRILERDPHPSQIGDIVTMGISGIRFFEHWPQMAAEHRTISSDEHWSATKKHTGEVILPPLKGPANRANGWEYRDGQYPTPQNVHLRPEFNNLLHCQLQRLGIAVSFGKRVVEYFENDAQCQAGVVLADGERLQADVVIAADGIGSKSAALIKPDAPRGQPSGRAAFRAAVPTDVVMKDPLVREQFGLQGGSNSSFQQFWLGPELHCVTHTRSDKTVLGINYAGSTETRESWGNTVSSAEVLEILERAPGLSPALPALVKEMPEGAIIHWPLILRNPDSRWVSPGGRIVQVGDGAHTFLPSSGNGATQALEDAVSLAECLRLAGKANVPEATRVHSKLRFERCACAQLTGFMNMQMLQHTDWEAAKKDPTLAQWRLRKWIWSHDPEKYASEKYREALDALSGGGKFENTNIPPGYFWEPWTFQDMMMKIRKGEQIQPKGDWF